MLNVRERSHLTNTATRDLKAELWGLRDELRRSHVPKRREWILDRIGFIEDLVRERNKP